MSSSPPPPPDYMGLAQQQAGDTKNNLTQQTWANRADQTNPWGTTTWDTAKTIDPATGQEVTKWTQNTALDPRLQATLNSQMATQQARSQQAQGLIGRMNTEFGQPIDWSGVQQYGDPSQIQAGGLQATTGAFGFGGGPTTGAYGQNFDTSRAQTPRLNTNLGQGAGQGLQGTLDYSGAQGVQGSDASRQRAEDAIYQSSTSRLDPAWQQKQAQLDSQLATRGITRGSAAYQQAQQGLGMQRNDAYQQAQMGAITGAGAEAQRNQGMDLALHGQQTGDINQQGQFQNQAQQQAYAQRLGAGQANNEAMGQAFGFGQQARASQLQGQQAQLGQEQQAFGQQQTANQSYLQQQQQAFAQQQAAGGQNFQQQLAYQQYQNQLRQQQVAEAMQQRGFSLNEMNALMSGQQVNMPNFQGYTSAQGAPGADLMGAAGQQAQSDAQRMAAQNASTGQWVSAAGTALGAYAGYAALAASDRRLKTDVRRVGRHARGFGIYTYRFIGERGRRLGVMAQEVRRIAPELVDTSRSYLRVNYGGL